MAICKKCSKQVGCNCNLDKNGLCTTCRNLKESQDTKIVVPNELIPSNTNSN